MKKLGIRAGIIFFWLLIISAALYLPKWERTKLDKNTINVFVWGDILSSSVIADFEKETGIKINISYYSSNEELIVKLKATKGEGYDLVIPSDYAVRVLAEKGLLKPLNKKLFDYWDSMHPGLLNQYFDPDNLYSIPFEWELYGFGIDKDFFAKYPTPASWNMLFNPETVHYKIAMDNDPIDAIAFASFYLFGPLESLSESQANEVREVLIRQKPWVAAYASFRADYFLATRNAALVVASTSYIWRAKRYCDFVKFVVPKEGSFITIENFCIPKPSQKEEIVFKFINYLSSAPSVVSHFETYSLFPATTHALPLLNMDEEARELLNYSKEQFKKYHFIRTVLPEQETRDIWVDVKS
jgi:spermidine/putrescine transport system substrate-binding protein